MKVAFSTIGCKLNQFETMVIREQLEKKNFKTVPFNKTADIYIINTCSVTSKSDYKSRQLIRRAISKNSNAFIIVTGCYAQLFSEELKKIKGIDLILGNSSKFNIVDYLSTLKKKSEPLINIENNPISVFPQIDQFGDYTRAFVKIQDGCNSCCSFCIVPKARGNSKSVTADKIYQQIDNLSEKYKEIVLTGTNLGNYKDDKIDLPDLLVKICKICKLKRLRLSSIEPIGFTQKLIEVIKQESKICRHFHIPLQSGDDEILKLMDRNYTSFDYKSLILTLRKEFPIAGIGSDVIVGFPCEQNKNFENTYQFLKTLPLTYLHVFNYSDRKGTKSSNFKDKVSVSIKKQRNKILQDLSKDKNFDFRTNLKNIKVSLEVLFENRRDNQTNFLTGLSDNYIRVMIDNKNDNLMNKIKNIKIIKVDRDKTYGEI